MTSSEHTTRSHASQRDRQGEEPSEDAARQHKEADRGGEERPMISISVGDAAMMFPMTRPGRTPLSETGKGEGPPAGAARQPSEADGKDSRRNTRSHATKRDRRGGRSPPKTPPGRTPSSETMGGGGAPEDAARSNAIKRDRGRGRNPRNISHAVIATQLRRTRSSQDAAAAGRRTDVLSMPPRRRERANTRIYAWGDAE